MITFNATIETAACTYHIDKKPHYSGEPFFAVMYNCPLTVSTNTIYFGSVAECLEWVNEHSEYVLSPSAQFNQPAVS